MAHENILVVEDEVIVAMEIESRLRRLGYRIAGPVRTGEDAIEAVRRERPDLVLMDIMLAGAMDGIAAASRITAEFGIPVVYLTAYADDETLGRAKVSEPFGYLVKPFEERELYTVLEIALYKHRLERRLQESELRYRSLFEHAGDAIFILGAQGDAAGLIVDANRAAAEMHGYAQEELIGLNIRDLDTPLAAAGTGERLQRILAGEWLRSEINHRRKDGTIVPVEISAGLLTLGEKRYVLAIDRDITERTRITAEREKELRLIMSERLASLGQMAAGIAHEINNPLAVIAGSAENLQRRVREGTFDPDYFLSYLTIIAAEIARCKGITTGMLSFVRESADETKTVRLNGLLAKTIDLFGVQGRLKHVEVVKRFAADLPQITGSEGELRQVFLAIIGNALDAMGERGTLSLETGVEGQSVFVRFGDTGAGVRTENLDNIFEPFFTTKAGQGGTGLGLSIARTIVMNHGGRIDVASQPGRGAVFTVLLPLPGSPHD